MIHPTMKWDSHFLEKAALVSTMSKDPSTKVGSVIVDDLRCPIGDGYNGFPRGVKDTVERYEDRELKYKIVVHAEANALLNSNKSVRGGTLYCTFCPCTNCAGLIIQAGIKRAVWYTSPSDERYNESQILTKRLFDEAGVEYLVYTRPNNSIGLPKVSS